MARGIKESNSYANALGSLYQRAPKSVLAAVAISLAGILEEDDLLTGRAQERVLFEWQCLYDNGIVPQKPPQQESANA